MSYPPAVSCGSGSLFLSLWMYRAEVKLDAFHISEPLQAQHALVPEKCNKVLMINNARVAGSWRTRSPSPFPGLGTRYDSSYSVGIGDSTDQTRQIISCKLREFSILSALRISACIPSGPRALPFLRDFIAADTSSKSGTALEIHSQG